MKPHDRDARVSSVKLDGRDEIMKIFDITKGKTPCNIILNLEEIWFDHEPVPSNAKSDQPFSYFIQGFRSNYSIDEEYETTTDKFIFWLNCS